MTQLPDIFKTDCIIIVVVAVRKFKKKTQFCVSTKESIFIFFCQSCSICTDMRKCLSISEIIFKIQMSRKYFIGKFNTWSYDYEVRRNGGKRKPNRRCPNSITLTRNSKNEFESTVNSSNWQNENFRNVVCACVVYSTIRVSEMNEWMNATESLKLYSMPECRINCKLNLIQSVRNWKSLKCTRNENLLVRNGTSEISLASMTSLNVQTVYRDDAKN